MKKIFIYISLFFVSFTSQAAMESQKAIESPKQVTFKDVPEVQALPTEVGQLSISQFLDLTPQKFTEMTGQKLGIANTLKLKAAQKIVKQKFGRGDNPIEKPVYILLAIFGLAWIPMGLADDWKGKNWITNLILSFLCLLPGIIHALVKMKEYYKS